MPEILKADPRARWKAILQILVATVAAMALVLVVNSQVDKLRDWVMEDSSQILPRVRILSAALSVALALPMSAFSVYLWRMGGRIRRVGRLPLPGTTVIRDTVVLEGPRAQRRGRVLQLLSLFLLVATAGFIAALWWLFAIAARSAA